MLSVACDNYPGILHIREGDQYAAAGTLFFVYVINHILYAKLYNLLPWVHFDAKGVSYDENVHRTDTTTTLHVPAGIASVTKIKPSEKTLSCENPRRPLGYPGNITQVDVLPLW